MAAELLIYPGDQLTGTATPPNMRAPVEDDRSIFFGRVEDSTLRMPTDEITGLPHAILPVDLPSDIQGSAINYHHHFYNRRHPDLEGIHYLTSEQLSNPERIPYDIIAGYAVRISRGQRLSVPLHREAHKRYVLGSVLPHTINEKFLTSVKACSGLISRYAIDVTASDDSKFVYMDDDLFARVASPKLLCTERVYYDKPANHRRRILGNFFLRYAVSQDLSHISEKKIDEFLNTDSDKVRAAVGNFILREAMEVSIAPVVPLYTQLKGQGMVQPGKPDIRSAIWKYVHPNCRAQVFGVLSEKLNA